MKSDLAPRAKPKSDKLSPSMIEALAALCGQDGMTRMTRDLMAPATAHALQRRGLVAVIHFDDCVRAMLTEAGVRACRELGIRPPESVVRSLFDQEP